MGFSEFGFCSWVFLVFCGFCFCAGDHVNASHGASRELLSVELAKPTLKYRTSFHFQPRKNWMNDPNGPMIFNGIYHLFYQYNPYGAVWGNIVWGHSFSTDLVNWNHLPVAIQPSLESDMNGCWSGSATIITEMKRPAIIYTGINSQYRQVQNIAYPKNLSDLHLRFWEKPMYNPIIAPDNEINSSAFRDPTTAWLIDGIWRLIIGSKHNRTGMAVLYRSSDFVKWEKGEHPLHSVNDSGMWECPDFFPVSTNMSQGLATSTAPGDGVKHVLKISLDEYKIDYYTIGNFDQLTDTYTPRNRSIDNWMGLRYDYGKFYASKTFFDEKMKRRLLWGWINESDAVLHDIAKGWAGLQCIPRKIWLASDGEQLLQWPIEEVEKLRKDRVSEKNLTISTGDLYEVNNITAAQADVEVEFRIENLTNAETFDEGWKDAQALCSKWGAEHQGNFGPFGLLVLASEGLEEYTAVFMRVFKANKHYVVLMCSDQTRSSLQNDVDKTTYGSFVRMDFKNESFSLRSLIDHSIVESFGGLGRACITARVYPTFILKKEAHLYLYNLGTEPVKVSKMNAWSMKAAKIS